jgi:hypothetical protein
MTMLAHGILDGFGFEIVTSFPWDLQSSEADAGEDKYRSAEGRNWGVIICRPPKAIRSGDESYVNGLYGVIGQIQANCIREMCLAIPLEEAPDLRNASSFFILACGLSIIDKTGLELGDTLVVAGANLLALSVLVAAKRQCARTACLISGSHEEVVKRLGMEQLSDALLRFDATCSFDSELDTFVASSRGKIVYVDTIGLPSVVHAMTSRLARFGTLALCRQDVSSSLPIDIRRDVHLKSAQIIYWSRPQSLEEALVLNACYRRAARLFRWERVSMLTAVTNGGLDGFSARKRH